MFPHEKHFYFIKDSFFDRFPGTNLMLNKEINNNQSHNRPCFFSFSDKKHNDIHWMIPISSKINKFESILDKKIKKYGHCDTIMFGNVLGKRKAFLIQNMFPVTDEYILNEYIDKNNSLPVMIDEKTANDIILRAQKVLDMHNRGISILFTDINKIRDDLLHDLSNSEKTIDNLKLLEDELDEILDLKTDSQINQSSVLNDVSDKSLSDVKNKKNTLKNIGVKSFLLSLKSERDSQEKISNSDNNIQLDNNDLDL